MQIDAIHQTSAFYNYSRYEKQASEEAHKKREAWFSFWLLLLFGSLLSVVFFAVYKKRQREKKEKINQLRTALAVSTTEWQKIKQELDNLNAKNYSQVILEKENKEKELRQHIQILEKEVGNLKEEKEKDNYGEFKNSQIVGMFKKKSTFSREHPLPNKAEWNMLNDCFMRNMPSLSRFVYEGRLSPLEIRICILLILDFEEGTIAGLTQSSSAAVSIAKRRANKKLFNVNSATTLKYNLKKLL
jgi:hypothetical protein